LTAPVVPALVLLVGCGTDAPAPAAGPFVFDEFKATGSPEWLEVVPAGAIEVDVGGYSIADTDKTTGRPRTADALKFPAGTKIAPGAHVLVMLGRQGVNGAPPVPGPHPKEECLPGGSATCFHAAFKISATTGEEVHVLDPSGKIVGRTSYPNNLVVGTTGKTVCRLPDKTGEFSLCTGTPGNPNTP
jgi:hypothetical protein